MPLRSIALIGLTLTLTKPSLLYTLTFVTSMFNCTLTLRESLEPVEETVWIRLTARACTSSPCSVSYSLIWPDRGILHGRFCLSVYRTAGYSKASYRPWTAAPEASCWKLTLTSAIKLYTCHISSSSSGRRMTYP